MTLKIDKKIKFLPKVGVFVDNSNIFYAQKKVGWKIDFQKLKNSLSLDLNLEFINYYAAVPAEWDMAYKSTVNYFDKIKNTVSLKTKQIKYIYTGKTIVDKKGDLDLELALDVVRNLDRLDIVIVMSGDSDYLELKNFVMENGKKIIFFGFEQNMAWEIKKYSKFLYLDNFGQELKLNFVGGVDEKINSKPKLGVTSLALLYPKE